jgi:prolipoprotein diacylglyceryltransferase
MAGIVMDVRVFKHISAALITSIIFSFIDTSWAVRWYSLAILAALFVGVYFVILWLIKEFGKDEFNMFMDALHPKKMLSYIGGEFKGKN